MDKQFMEFWGNIMLASAKGQQQFEDIMKWFSGDFGGFKEITALFCRMYGLDPEAQSTPGYLKVWQNALDDFKRSFNELAVMMDFVPRKDYIALSSENLDLKKRIAELEEGTSHLRALLDERLKVPGEGERGFQQLIDEQARQYQDLMKNISNVFEERPNMPAGQPSYRPKPPEAPPTKTKPKAKAATKAGRKAAKSPGKR